MPDSASPSALSTHPSTSNEFHYPMIREVASKVWSSSGRLSYIDATDLAHDCFLRLARTQKDLELSRAAKIAYCTTIIRRVLVDEVRKRSNQRLVSRPTVILSRLADGQEPRVDLVDLDRALDELAEIDPRQAQLVELKFFGGYNQEEAGEIAGISERTVRREWALARAWLLHRLKDSIID